MDYDKILNELDTMPAETVVSNASDTTKAEDIPDTMLDQRKINSKINSKVDYSDEFKEVKEHTASYLNEFFSYQERLEELKEEFTAIKENAKTNGVMVTNVHKAVKEMVSNLKESSEDAKNIEDTKRMIEENGSLHDKVIAQANS